MKIGARIHWVKTCSSTNDLARELALGGEEEGTVVVSEEQTKGRGTKGRSWYSAKKKGAYVSVILRPSRSNISLLPLVGGLAASEAVLESAGIRVWLKWPNDLIWEKRKLGGILCESAFLGNRPNYVILGIGINISHRREDFPEEIRSQSTSLELITGEDIKAKVVLANLWKALNRWYDFFLQGEEEKIISTFEENSIFPLGKELTLLTEKSEISGIYRGIDSCGGLILGVRGKKTSFYAGQIKSIT